MNERYMVLARWPTGEEVGDKKVVETFGKPANTKKEIMGIVKLMLKELVPHEIRVIDMKQTEPMEVERKIPQRTLDKFGERR